MAPEGLPDPLRVALGAVAVLERLDIPMPRPVRSPVRSGVIYGLAKGFGR